MPLITVAGGTKGKEVLHTGATEGASEVTFDTVFCPYIWHRQEAFAIMRRSCVQYLSTGVIWEKSQVENAHLIAAHKNALKLFLKY